jgi:hypothetical protein
LLLGAAACGDRRLDLSLELAPDTCTMGAPAGGSLLVEVEGPGGILCTACLPISEAAGDAAALLADVQNEAPICPGIVPNTTLAVALTAYSEPLCPAQAPRLFCSRSPTVGVPDGRSDAAVVVVMTCDTTCTGACVPTTCAALGKDCGAVSDGCGATLQCGTCSPPDVCGGRNGSGTANVCSK